MPLYNTVCSIIGTVHVSARSRLGYTMHFGCHSDFFFIIILKTEDIISMLLKHLRAHSVRLCKI